MSAAPSPADAPFWEQPLAMLTRHEWEALCDGCGKCCLLKLEDEDTGEFYHTSVACKLLDLETGRCRSYATRRAHVPDCIRLNIHTAGELEWLPDSCAYRLRARGEPLPAWHYLVSGDRGAVHREGMSVVGRVISEEAIDRPIEQYIVWPEPPIESSGDD